MYYCNDSDSDTNCFVYCDDNEIDCPNGWIYGSYTGNYKFKSFYLIQDNINQIDVSISQTFIYTTAIKPAIVIS